MFLVVGLGLLGFADDYIKLAKGRNLGLNKKQKLLGQAIIAIVFALLVINFPDRNGLTPGSTKLSFIRDIPAVDFMVGGAVVGTIIFIICMYLLLSAWSNAVNLTDGLDGLAAGSTAMVMGAYTLITFWQYRNACVPGHNIAGCFSVRDPLDLAIITAAGLGACLGFLWWNAAPAKIFMGDTGSLALGGLVAGISVCSRTELLMVIIGGLFVVEVLSVVIQIISFRGFGKRVFKMAPIHHHFEHCGWAETTVVIRFWLLTGAISMIGVAIFYGLWLNATGI